MLETFNKKTEAEKHLEANNIFKKIESLQIKK